MSYGPLPSFQQILEWNKLLTRPQIDWKALEGSVKVGFWNHHFSTTLGRRQACLAEIIRNLNDSLARLEQEGVLFFSEDSEKAQNYRAKFTPYFQLGRGIRAQIQQIEQLNPSSTKLKQNVHKLESNLMGLQYRLGASNGGMDQSAEVHARSFERLKELALKWKRKWHMSNDNKNLNVLELEQLREASKYEEWIPFLSNNQKYADEFFNWALRDYNLVDVFVKYRVTQQSIKKSLSSPILGRIRKRGESELTLQTVATEVAGVSKQILTLPLYHGRFDRFEKDKQERINILNPSDQVHFKNGNRKMKVRDVWDEMGLKNTREANVNICAWGIINSHPVHGTWHPDQKRYVMPEITKHNWTHHVPPAEVVSGEEIQARYGKKLIDKNIFFKVAATRQAPGLNALNCHGFTQIFIRMDDGSWRVLDLGFYAYRFQKGLLDGLWLFCATMSRVFCRQDQNGSYTHRQQARYPLFFNPDGTQRTLDRFYEEAVAEDVFQFSGKNCSYPIQKIMKENTNVNFFCMPITQGSVGFKPLDKMLALLDRSPSLIKKLGTLVLSFILFSARFMLINRRGKWAIESVAKYYLNTHDFYNPALLHDQIEKAKRENRRPMNAGELYWGNTEGRLIS